MTVYVELKSSVTVIIDSTRRCQSEALRVDNFISISRVGKFSKGVLHNLE